MMVDIEVKKETKEEAMKKKKKEKEAEYVNPVTNMAISAPPPYKTLKPTGGPSHPLSQLTVAPLAKPDSSQQSQPNSGFNSGVAEQQNKGSTGETIVSKTIKTETYTKSVKSVGSTAEQQNKGSTGETIVSRTIKTETYTKSVKSVGSTSEEK
ncbi:unnamed protein product [Strongylus vulgaris]|uniref:Uncharacterized protein n=1 Tax=Strongylus vulgaris TaxID=40348 RepID=A0A3P7JFR4_STRVU|nr:unnamed protein product [Strongylus vulgaris]